MRSHRPAAAGALMLLLAGSPAFAADKYAQPTTPDAKPLPVAKPPAGAPKQLVVHPARVMLAGPRDEQQLVVLGVWADGRQWDLTRSATYSSQNPKAAVADRRG